MKIRMFIFLLFFSSCLAWRIEDPSNLYLKKIKFEDAIVLWYYHSLITSTPPDWIVIKYFDSSFDTICQAENINDVKLKGKDTLVIVFNSIPKKYNRPTWVKKQSRSHVIMSDTTGEKVSIYLRHKNYFEDTI